MMEVLVATGNEHKLREMRHILGSGFKVLGYGKRVKEDGRTFEENAVKKAKSIRPKEGQIAIADDSGLMVSALNGKPGVKSARFASPPTPENLCTKLLRKLGVRNGGRGAKFVCVIAVHYPSGRIKTVKGICCGKIINEMRGNKGFGYDPVFVPRGYRRTFAEMRPAMKNRLSHRGRALRKLKVLLGER
ncbi:MAG: RdgB/HAM1 family non-canonical purine NTP pyrophosphatase [Candidatus Saganbacteria bacterium]|nr:RdgB/HAM1 family non-canonical purine NTP pyrophosphatase [Candidatus Saganbacteria bacterium]